MRRVGDSAGASRDGGSAEIGGGGADQGSSQAHSGAAGPLPRQLQPGAVRSCAAAGAAP